MTVRSRRITLWVVLAAALGVCAAPACSGKDGADGTNCTVTNNGDGTGTITCDDGTSTTFVTAGGCSVVDNGDGTKTITCDDGTTVTIGDGDPGLNAGESPGLAPVVTSSDPANGTHHVAGDRIVITIELLDADGNPLALDDLDQAALYMNGPRAMSQNTSSVALLNADVDRDVRPHHYIDLLTSTSADLVVNGNIVQYTLQPITSELPGTYMVGLRARLADFERDQVFTLHELQIGTDVVEPEIVGNCDTCHQGASNGQYYLHHVDPRNEGQFGSPAIDSLPIQTCRMCHNQDGYASRRYCDDGSMPSRSGSDYICEDGTQNWQYIPDPMVRRVHGVHNGINLSSYYNTNPVNGDFLDYAGVVFPADIRNCTKCHTDDSWATNPSRQACGACHDDVDFATGTNHAGGIQTDDTACAGCHTSTPGVGTSPIPDRHAIPAFSYEYSVGLTMTAPANGTHYVAGEAPVITVVLTNTTTGQPLDHTQITEASGLFDRFYLYVSGPRARRIPVLTSAARPEIVNTIAGPWDLTGAADFQLVVGDRALDLDPETGTFAATSMATAQEVTDWLNGDAAFNEVAVAFVVGNTVGIRTRPSDFNNSIAVLTSDVGTVMGYAVGKVDVQQTTYADNVLYKHTDPTENDPKVTWNTGSITYQLDDVEGLAAGTYTVWVEAGRFAALPLSSAKLNFQIGTDTDEPWLATNCTSCHEDTRMHAGFFAVPFDPDICGSCHDWKRQFVARQASDPPDGWGANAATGRSNFGFGSAPLARRVHGVHFGHYVNFPREIHGSYDYSEVIFPQDVRNCVKCHSQTDAWMEQPSRVACLGCHDSTEAKTHASLMTFDASPTDPYNGDEVESCKVCHHPGHTFGVDVVHNISSPYAPPYPRE